MRKLRQNSRRLFRHAALLSLVAVASVAAPSGAIMALMPAAGPNLEGRWVEDAQPKEKKGIERIGTLDIMACGDSMCAVQVSASGECGTVVGRFGPPDLRPTKAGDKFDAVYAGTLQWRGRKDAASIFLSNKGLGLTAHPDALAASLSRSVMLSYNGGFTRAGAASCAPPLN